jgi:hypothetical protein
MVLATGRRSHGPTRRRQVHRPRLATRDAASAPVQLREHGAELPAFGDIETVRAIGRKNQIVSTQSITDSDSDRLLADRQMDRTLDLVGWIELDDPLFDEADQQRRPEHPTIDRFILHWQTLPGR